MRTIFLLAFLWTVVQGQAQSLSGPSYRIRYDCMFNELFDRQRQDRHYLAELHLQGDKSYFFLTPDRDLQTEPDAPNTTVFHLDTLLRVAKERAAGRLVFGDPFLKGKDQYFLDSLFPMQWEPIPGERWVGAFHCKGAKATFKGREYICWYCPEIPIPEGPWKLGGLPGLITEAYDEQEDLHFIISNMDSTDGVPLSPPKGMKGDLTGYESYREHWRNIARNIEASMAMSDGSDCVSCQTRSKIKFYLWERPLD